MRTYGVAAFKDQCLGILDNLGPEGVIVTRRGRPIARVLPFHDASGAGIGRLAGLLEIHGDVESTGIAWEADDQP